MSALDFATDRNRLDPLDPRPAWVRRARFLPRHDRALVEAVYAGQLSQREIARLLNLPPGTVHRRYRRLARRLNDPIVVALLESPLNLSAEDRQLGVEHYLLARTIPALARAHQRTRYDVRKTLAYLRGWSQRLSSRP